MTYQEFNIKSPKLNALVKSCLEANAKELSHHFCTKMDPNLVKSAEFDAATFDLISDGWTTDDLIYRWKENDPVQIVKELNLPRFKLESFDTKYCNTKTNTGT